MEFLHCYLRCVTLTGLLGKESSVLELKGTYCASSCRPIPAAASGVNSTTASNNCSKPDNTVFIVNGTCEIGFSYNPNDDSCVKYCEKYGMTFYPVTDKCIIHIKSLTSNMKQASACESLPHCVSETSFTCRSVKYAPYKEVGYWTNHTALTVPDRHAVDDCPNTVYYQRNYA